MGSELTDFSRRVIGNVKAELARRDLNGNDLIEPLGLGRNAIYSRLKGERPFETEELAKIAEFLKLPIEALVAQVELGAVA